MSEALATKDDPKGTLSYRLARAAVIILGALLVIAFVMLVVGIGLKMSGHQVASGAADAPSKYVLEPGARILSVDSQPGRVILHIRSATGDEVDIVDVQSGRLVSQIKSASR